MYKPQYPGLYYFDNFTFTSLGTSGHEGPGSSRGYANAPWRPGDFSIQDGQQYWTVPTNGTYQITAAGAYGTKPGRVVTGQTKLSEGQTLRMLVGQRPSNTYAGGGTWVSTDQKLLMVASGGDGTGGANGSFSPYGTGIGQNGAGYLTDGLSSNVTYPFLVPRAYVNGGFGNYSADNSIEAGFGGGNLVGGGGYTGSPGDGVSGATCYADAFVSKFTDLGTSNSSGYVNVSLVDPVPLQQTWTWDPNQFNDATLKCPVYTTSWSKELNKFLSYSGTSSNGFVWDALTLLDVEGYQVYNPSLFLDPILITAYSSTLNIYTGIRTVGNPGSSTFYLAYSYDCQNWHNSVDMSGGPVVVELTGYGLIWAPELNVFVAFYRRGYDYALYSSTDGITWTVRLTGSGGAIGDLVYSAQLQRFVLAGNSDNFGYFSDDGVTWTPNTNDLGPDGASIIWVPKFEKFFSFKFDEIDGTVYIYLISSSDGATWSLVDGCNLPSAHEYWKLVWSDEFELMSALGYNKTAYSSDGVNWNVVVNQYGTITQFGYAYSPSLKTYVATQYGNFVVSLDGKYWVKPYSYYPTLSWGSYSPELNCIVAYDPVGTNSTYNSFDSGKTWNIINGLNSGLYIIYSRELNMFIGFHPADNFSGGNIFYSTDGSHFTDTMFVTNGGSIAWSPELGLFSGAAYSRDGKTWTTAELSTPIYSCGWSSDLKLFTGIADYEIPGMSCITYGNGTFVGFAGFRPVYSTDNGLTWKTPFTNLPVSVYVSGVAFGNGRFVGVAVNSAVYSIDNGLTWVNVSVGSKYWNSVTFGNGTFVAVGYSIRSYSNDNGNTWTDSPSTSSIWTSVTFGNGVFVAVSENNVTAYSTNGQTWTNVSLSGSWTGVAYGNGVFVAVGTNVQAYSTNNGQTWTSVSIPLIDSWISVAFGNNIFVMGSENSFSAYSTDNGQTWTSILLKVDVVSFTGVAYGNGRFVIVTPTQDPYNVAYSDDGQYWELVPSLQVQRSYYSYNGINWNLGSNVTTDSSSTYYNPVIPWSSTLGLFVCGFKDQTYRTSIDGKTWSSPIPGLIYPDDLPIFTIFWNPNLKVFIMPFYYSYDAIHWTYNLTFEPTVQASDKIITFTGYIDLNKTF